MGLRNYKISFLILFLFISSCAKNYLTGTYEYRNNKTYNYPGIHSSSGIYKGLTLNKDSGFIYKENENSFNGFEDSYRGVFGKGKYQIKGNDLILNFIPEIRDVFKIKIDTLILSELENIKATKFARSNIDDAYIIKIHINFSQNQDENIPEVIYTGGMNGTTYEPTYSLYRKSEFPVHIKFDFKRFQGFIKLHNTEVNIEKPGNYDINVELYDDSTDEKISILEGQKVLPIYYGGKTVRIDSMTKVKKKESLNAKKS